MRPHWMMIVALLAGCGRSDREPAQAKATTTAPASFRVRFQTSAGPFVVEVTRAWAPHGADRLYDLVRQGFYDGGRFFRVVPGFVVQFGLSGDPAVSARWRPATIPDDPVTQHNTRGTLTFATAAPCTSIMPPPNVRSTASRTRSKMSSTTSRCSSRKRVPAAVISYTFFPSTSLELTNPSSSSHCSVG